MNYRPITHINLANLILRWSRFHNIIMGSNQNQIFNSKINNGQFPLLGGNNYNIENLKNRNYKINNNNPYFFNEEEEENYGKINGNYQFLNVENFKKKNDNIYEEKSLINELNRKISLLDEKLKDVENFKKNIENNENYRHKIIVNEKIPIQEEEENNLIFQNSPQKIILPTSKDYQINSNLNKFQVSRFLQEQNKKTNNKDIYEVPLMSNCNFFLFLFKKINY